MESGPPNLNRIAAVLLDLGFNATSIDADLGTQPGNEISTDATGLHLGLGLRR